MQLFKTRICVFEKLAIFFLLLWNRGEMDKVFEWKRDSGLWTNSILTKLTVIVQQTSNIFVSSRFVSEKSCSRASISLSQAKSDILMNSCCSRYVVNFLGICFIARKVISVDDTVASFEMPKKLGEQSDRRSLHQSCFPADFFQALWAS